jgi:hypothetical protein
MYLMITVIVGAARDIGRHGGRVHSLALRQPLAAEGQMPSRPAASKLSFPPGANCARIEQPRRLGERLKPISSI